MGIFDSESGVTGIFDSQSGVTGSFDFDCDKTGNFDFESGVTCIRKWCKRIFVLESGFA